MKANLKPTCFEPGRIFNEIYHGVPSFLGLPVAKSANEIIGNEIAVMGVPWEGPVTWGKFSGCELATKTIRDASKRLGGFLPEYGYDLFDYLNVCDYGDTAVVPGDTESTHHNIHQKASDIFKAGAVPVVFGGDHSITVPVIQAMAENVDGKIGIIHLDAHMDNMFEFGEEKFARCSPLHRIYENEGVDPKNVVHMGIRGPRNNPKQMKSALDVGASIITGYEIKKKGIDCAIQKALEIAKDGTDAVFVTVCSDILDVAFNPGGPPDMNGLTTFELSEILFRLAAAGINGFDFVEVYPSTDLNQVSSHTAAWMAIYVMSGIAKHRFNLEIPQF